MPKKGGRTSIAANVEQARQLLFALIDLLETEFDKLGDSTSMTRSQYEELSGDVNATTERLGQLMGPVRDLGIEPDESYNSMFEHASDLILRLETEFEITGGNRRSKTTRK